MSEWIDVRVKRPEGECLAIGYQNELLIGHVYEDLDSATGWACEAIEYEDIYLEEVTHWMELPVPPKERMGK
ncbi:MAG: DUF551 domain-containing protein [Peptococcaceae bacterium]|nr:DUF551 domain-containing protein [Peptococcaceae bacterium]